MFQGSKDWLVPGSPEYRVNMLAGHTSKGGIPTEENEEGAREETFPTQHTA